MNRNVTLRAAAIALTASLALAACNREEPAPVPAPTTAPAPAPAPAPMPAPPPAVAPAVVTVTAVDVGNSTGPDGRVTAAGSTFATSDTITASVDTNATGDQATATLGARWVFEDGQVVNEEQKMVTFTGPGTTNFQISKPDGWPAGRYTLEVSVNGNVVETRQFEIR